LEEVRLINEDYQLKKKGLLENWGKYEERIRAASLTDEQKSFLLEDSPRRQLRIKEVLGQNVASSLGALWENAKGDPKWQQEIQKYEGDPVGLNSVRKQFVDETLSKYEYQDGFLALISVTVF
jgi:hypothetical protein